MNKFAAFIVNLALYVPLALLGGVVLSDLWGWFIVPVFSAPTLTVRQAIGLMIVAGFFKIGLMPWKLEEGDDIHPVAKTLTYKAAWAFVYLFVWGVAYLWRFFI